MGKEGARVVVVGDRAKSSPHVVFGSEERVVGDGANSSPSRCLGERAGGPGSCLG